ncbi:hypothetical protein CHARACLAT_007870 [Characodon lateralis]|uniref:Ig-like domain-containing protein n=1 Tax=Characodon lateralis TaxID=208331 RepID=A0ABU7DR74_9TELE|nr:hypothetical protein [Characodon lateralis]
MRGILMMMLFAQAASAVKHSLEFDLMLSSGFPNVPEYVAMEILDGVIIAYYDSDIKTGQTRLEWVRKLMQNNSQHWEMHLQNCIHYQQVFKVETLSFQQSSNQTGGGHVIQQIAGCEWDDETGEVEGFKQYAYNGEGFLTFDMQTQTWITSHPQAEKTKQEWDKDKINNGHWKNLLTTDCIAWLKMYLNYGMTFLYRKDPPSVSLLQKTPSSPFCCHATGFHPNNAVMSWRKDGEELHEGVEDGEILPNNDGSFQMSGELNISSVAPEDWRRYDCVFQLSGVKDDIVTTVDKTVVRTNHGKGGTKEKPSDLSIAIIVVVLIIVFISTAVGFRLYKKRKVTEMTPELSQRLNPETSGTNTSSTQ